MEKEMQQNRRYFSRKHPTVDVELLLWRNQYDMHELASVLAEDLNGVERDVERLRQLPSALRLESAGVAHAVFEEMRRRGCSQPSGWFGEMPNDLSQEAVPSIHSVPFRSRGGPGWLGLYTPFAERHFGFIVVADYWRHLSRFTLSVLLGELTRISQCVVLVSNLAPTAEEGAQRIPCEYAREVLSLPPMHGQVILVTDARSMPKA
jgi:hypothetical protein